MKTMGSENPQTERCSHTGVQQCRNMSSHWQVIHTDSSAKNFYAANALNRSVMVVIRLRYDVDLGSKTQFQPPTWLWRRYNHGILYSSNYYTGFDGIICRPLIDLFQIILAWLRRGMDGWAYDSCTAVWRLQGCHRPLYHTRHLRYTQWSPGRLYCDVVAVLSKSLTAMQQHMVALTVVGLLIPCRCLPWCIHPWKTIVFTAPWHS